MKKIKKLFWTALGVLIIGGGIGGELDFLETSQFHRHQRLFQDKEFTRMLN